MTRRETIQLTQSQTLSISPLGDFPNKILLVLPTFWLLQQQLPDGVPHTVTCELAPQLWFYTIPVATNMCVCDEVARGGFERGALVCVAACFKDRGTAPCDLVLNTQCCME